MNGYRYDAVKAKVKAGGYDTLTTDEKFDWHADIYGWRVVRLGVAEDVRTSPVDPDGKWYNAVRVSYAVEYYRSRTGPHPSVQARNDALTSAEALEIKNRWSRHHGYADFEDYMARERLDWGDASGNVARSLIAASERLSGKSLDDPPDADPHALLKALGVTATETPRAAALRQRAYDPEELRKDRIALERHGMPRQPRPQPEPPSFRAPFDDDDPVEAAS